MTSRPRATRPPIALAIAATLLAGCGFLPGVGNDTLHVLNNTTIAVTLVVNDQPVAVIEPSTSRDVGAGALPATPWLAEVRTASGRDLVSLEVSPGSVHDHLNLDGTGSYSAPGAGVDLSCGQVRLSVVG